MKILWITNVPIGGISKKINGRRSSAAWMEAMLDQFVQGEEHELIVVTLNNRNEWIRYEESGVRYHLLPGKRIEKYNYKNKNNINIWEKLLQEVQPDLIQIWGSEMKLGLGALAAARDEIPFVIYIQGIISGITRYYYAGMSRSTILKNITIHDILRNNTIFSQRRRFKKKEKHEREMYKQAGRVIGENLWSRSHSKAIDNEIKFFQCPLSMKKDFLESNWSIQKAEEFSIMCNSANYTIKGLHILVQALALVKMQYPGVKLYIPGTNFNKFKGRNRIKRSGYCKYINKLIEKMNLHDNIIFTGNLSSNEMSEKMSEVRCFVVSSSIENHSSTLKEAMMVGTPCVASAVGGIPEYIKHGENGFLYRFEEYELLAEYIKVIFENNELSQTLSDKAKRDITELHDDGDIYDTMNRIYEEIVEGEGSEDAQDWNNRNQRIPE